MKCIVGRLVHFLNRQSRFFGEVCILPIRLLSHFILQYQKKKKKKKRERFVLFFVRKIINLKHFLSH